MDTNHEDDGQTTRVQQLFGGAPTFRECYRYIQAHESFNKTDALLMAPFLKLTHIFTRMGGR